MECLGQISAIKDKIKLSSRSTVVALHKILFGVEGDRGNRQKIRESAGFSFLQGSDDFRAKMDYMGCFSIWDLISVCNLLGINHEGTKEQIRRNILSALMDINSLVSTLREIYYENILNPVLYFDIISYNLGKTESFCKL